MSHVMVEAELDGIVDATYYVLMAGQKPSTAENTAVLQTRHLGVCQRFRNRVPNESGMMLTYRL